MTAQKNDRVKIKGSEQTGYIVEIVNKYIPSENRYREIYVVQIDGGQIMDFFNNELKKVE